MTVALFVALFASAPLVAALHADDHAHVYCAEHQAIEESTGAPQSNDNSAAHASLTAPFEDARGHERCELFALTVRTATLNSVPGGAHPAAAAQVPEISAAVHARRVVPVLFEAPKASPPNA